MESVMCRREEVTRALDFFRRHRVTPRAAYRWLDEKVIGPYQLELEDELVEIGQEARDELMSLLQGLTIHGAL